MSNHPQFPSVSTFWYGAYISSQAEGIPQWIAFVRNTVQFVFYVITHS